MSEQKTKDDGFVTVATKVPPHVAELLNILARMRGMQVYELLQLLVNGFISYAKAESSVPDEFRHLYESLKFDVAYNAAYNFASPTAQQDIAQMVLILQQPGRSGFGLMMIDRPYFDTAQATVSIPEIVDRLLSLALGFNDYVRLRQLNAGMDSTNTLDTLRTMIDAQTILNMEESDRAEMPGYGNYHDYGRAIEYGKRTKQKKHRTPDSLANSHRLLFHDFDRETGVGAAFGTSTDPADEVEEAIGTKPFTEEP